MEKKYVLVVGSGIHHYVKEGKEPGLLASWELLLDEVASVAKFPSGNRLLSPSARWEEILLSEVKKDLEKKGKSNAVYKKESTLRRNVANVINKFINSYSVDKSRAEIFKKTSVADIISLNFESSWLGFPEGIDVIVPEFLQCMEAAAATLMLDAYEKKRIYSRAQSENGARIWFPNGHLDDPRTLRLGFRDFGLQANTLKSAYDEFKIWEKRVLKSEDEFSDVAPQDSRAYRKILNSYFSGTGISGGLAQPADNWVTAFMLLEPIFLGVGMSPDEQGLWWLLHQRARNLARVPSARPPRILKICPPCIEAEYGRFLSGSHVLEPIWCRTWEEGWARVEQILDGK